jgi:hypothetical protein
MALLEQVRDMFDSDRFVFPGQTRGSPMSPRVLQSLMCKQLREPFAAHGFRAAFSTWANDYPAVRFRGRRDVSRASDRQRNVRVYDRAEKIAKRAVILQTWAHFVRGAQASNVVPFAASART